MNIISTSDSMNIYFVNWDETNNGGFKSNLVSATLLVKEGFEGNPILTRFVPGGTTSIQLYNLKKITKYQILAIHSNPMGNFSLTVNTASGIWQAFETNSVDLSNDSPFYFSFGVMQPMWVLSCILIVFHLILSCIGFGAKFALKST